jgi:hypothetical protein
MANIAEIGGANVERKIGKASVLDAIIGTGVVIDKMLALTSQLPVGIQIANIQMPSPEEREEIDRRHRALDEITRLLHKQEPLSVKEELMVTAQLCALKSRHHATELTFECPSFLRLLLVRRAARFSTADLLVRFGTHCNG